jgi:hypothetical protein
MGFIDFHVVTVAIKLILPPHPTSRSFFRLQAKLQDQRRQAGGLCGQFEFLTSEDFCDVLFSSAQLQDSCDEQRRLKRSEDMMIERRGEWGDIRYNQSLRRLLFG